MHAFYAEMLVSFAFDSQDDQADVDNWPSYDRRPEPSLLSLDRPKLGPARGQRRGSNHEQKRYVDSSSLRPDQLCHLDAISS